MKPGCFLMRGATLPAKMTYSLRIRSHFIWYYRTWLRGHTTTDAVHRLWQPKTCHRDMNWESKSGARNRRHQ